jgi:hypothetical protein
MTLKATKRLLMLGTLTLAGGSACILIWGMGPTFSAPDDKALSLEPVHTASKASNNRTPNKLVARVDSQPVTDTSFAAIWDRPLRRALFDPPPPPPRIVEKRVLPPIRAKLLATMIERDNSTAVLRLMSGEVVFRKVGDALGRGDPDATVARIEAGTVCVSRAGGETRLVIDGLKSK